MTTSGPSYCTPVTYPSRKCKGKVFQVKQQTSKIFSGKAESLAYTSLVTLPWRVLNFEIDLKLFYGSIESDSHVLSNLSSEHLGLCNDFPFVRIGFSRYGARWILWYKLWGLLLSALYSLFKKLSLVSTIDEKDGQIAGKKLKLQGWTGDQNIKQTNFVHFWGFKQF